MTEAELVAGRYSVGQVKGGLAPGLDRSTGDTVSLVWAEAPERVEALRCAHSGGLQLQSPHIAAVVGLHRHGPGWVLVSQRVGRPIEAQLQEPTEPAEVWRLAWEITLALVVAHDHGLVHGDLRAEHVRVGERGACVSGFGLVPLGPRPGETAPERLQGGPPTVAADLYGLGVLLHRALMGERPFRGATPWAVMGAQSAGPACPTRGPAGLRTLVRMLTDPDPSSRPPTALSVRGALRSLRSRPHRRPELPRATFAPLAPGRAWLIHGVDPKTGAHVMVRKAVSRAQADELAEHLVEQGWHVRAARRALGWVDLLWVLALTAAGGVILPLAGAIPSAVLAWRWRSRGCRTDLLVLPAATAPEPPLPVKAPGVVTVQVGLLMIVAAGTLYWQSWWALAPLLGLCAVFGMALRYRDEDEVAPRRARVLDRLDQARGMAQAAALDLDEQLGVLGEIEELELQVHRDGSDADVLARVDAIIVSMRAP